MPGQPVPARQELTLDEVLQQTRRARRSHGWAAVAPVLEPYVDATHWPSGAPLPLQLSRHTRRRRRSPPQLPPFRSLHHYVFWAAYTGVLICMCVYAWSRPMRDACSGVPIPQRVAVFLTAFLSPFACVGAVRWLFTNNPELRSHVSVLYLLLFMDTASPGDRETLLQQVFKKNDLYAIGCDQLDLPAIPAAALDLELQALDDEGSPTGGGGHLVAAWQPEELTVSGDIGGGKPPDRHAFASDMKET